MKKLIALVALSALVACSAKQKCDTQDKFVNTMAPLIATQLACSNEVAIRTDIDAALSKAGLCKRDEAKAVGIQGIGVPPAVCPIAAALVVEVIGSQVPKEWGCTGGNVKAGLQAALTAACMAATGATESKPADAQPGEIKITRAESLQCYLMVNETSGAIILGGAGKEVPVSVADLKKLISISEAAPKKK